MMSDYIDPISRKDDDHAEERRYAVGRGVAITVVTVIVLGMFVAGVTIAYQLGRESGGTNVTPIIRADLGPIKIRPSEPGGMKIPNQDKGVYGQLATGQADPKSEKLLPTAERPIESLLTSIKPPAVTPGKPADGTAAAVGPASVATLAPPIKAPALPSSGPAVSKDLGASAVKKKAGAETVPKSAPRVATTPTVKQRAAGKAPRQVASVNLDLKKAAPSRYVVQLASTRSEKNARRAWSKLRKSHPALFGNMREMVQRKNLGAKKGTWYRLMVGSFSSKTAARSFCGRAQKRKVACLAVRR